MRRRERIDSLFFKLAEVLPRVRYVVTYVTVVVAIVVNEKSIKGSG